MENTGQIVELPGDSSQVWASGALPHVAIAFFLHVSTMENVQLKRQCLGPAALCTKPT